MPDKPSRNLHQRLHAAMKEVKYIQKDIRIKLKSGSYKVISHDAVTAKVRPALLKQGIIYYPMEMVRSQNGNRTEVDLKVRFANIDNPGDCIDVPGIGYGVDSGDKGPGMAVSYAVKYCLLKALGLETGDDADLSSSEDKVVEVDPRAGAGVPAEEPVSFDLISPVGEVEKTFPNVKDYITELANRLANDGNYWPSNEHVVDFIAENYPLPGYKKWVRQIRKLGKAAHESAIAAKASESAWGARDRMMPTARAEKELADDQMPEEKRDAERAKSEDEAVAKTQETHAVFAEEDLTDIPPAMDRRAKFQLLSPKGKTKTFTDAKKFLGALEKEMLADPVTWWGLNGNLAKQIAENGDAATKGWVDGLLEMAVEGGKEEVNPLGAG